MLKKKFLPLLSLLLFVFFMVGCAQKTGQPTTTKAQVAPRNITDMAGKKIVIPNKINRIGDAWPAHNEVLDMLGQGNKIVSTILTAKGRPWLYKINPQMNNAVTAFTKNDVNIEELLKTKPDIIFLPTGTKYADKVTSVGIPAVQLTFKNFTELKKCFQVTGNILGPDATKMADAFNSYLDSKLKMITDITSTIPTNKKPKVMHVNTLSPLTIDGGSTIIDSWIKVAGGINVSSGVTGNAKEVSMEQIMKWNPDIIIFGPDAKEYKTVINTDAWKKVAAVKNNKVVQNPDGGYMWDRYSAEEALQIQWAAKLITPDKFQKLDIVSETRSFYKTFLNYDLSKAEAKLIISGKPPVKVQ
ncbi:ABC transporter substrate-binding protein [Clostridium estertheticum]|uniref:ABC transporter substrate-binding protein n=1 Tax=Clostridium estertheticum TaxID=238834 RepID=UPI001C7CA288|nr:ABC transporter substrate-binding protein [Clostridium estertheticum]MBX4264183.1 ABC transporter substrate-binding protein [Clostridium estertheticum]WLC89041.1 ABC transporter substrate-binding protein [Clostridium estertheticum]